VIPKLSKIERKPSIFMNFGVRNFIVKKKHKKRTFMFEHYDFLRLMYSKTLQDPLSLQLIFSENKDFSNYVKTYKILLEKHEEFLGLILEEEIFV
jgi:hypothetical protein